MAIRDRINLFSTPLGGNVRPTFSTTAPTDTTVPWIDITTRPYVLNYYYNGAWEPISGGVASTTPTISKSSLSGTLTSTFGTASTSATFTLSGTNITAGILVTAPQYFEVSLAFGSGYGSTTTVTGTGTIAATTVYVRLAATAPVANYNLQSIALTSAGATNANVTTSATGNSVSSSGGGTTITDGFTYLDDLFTYEGDYFSQPSGTAPTINSSSLSGTLTSTFGTASTSATFTLSGTNITAGILVTAPTGLEVSLAPGGTYSSTITVTGTGTIAATTVYVRLAATALVGNYNSQNIVLTSSGATTANVTTTSSGNSVSSSGGIPPGAFVDLDGVEFVDLDGNYFVEEAA